MCDFGYKSNNKPLKMLARKASFLTFTAYFIRFSERNAQKLGSECEFTNCCGRK